MAEWKGKSAEQLAEELNGTCDILPEEFDDAPPSFLQELDEQVFRCETCGWWSEVDEAVSTDTDDFICQDCYEENES